MLRYRSFVLVAAMAAITLGLTSGCPTAITDGGDDDPCAGVVCDDGDLCTADSCSDGSCVFAPVDCPEGETCDSDTGQCGRPVPSVCTSRSQCDDGDDCTDDTCIDGECVFTEVQCDSGETCIDGECVSDDQCEFVDCDDGMFCNGAETCLHGECVAGTNPCALNETCDESADECVAEPAAPAGLPFRGWRWTIVGGNAGKCYPTYIFIHDWDPSDSQINALEDIAQAVRLRLQWEDPPPTFHAQANTALWYWDPEDSREEDEIRARIEEEGAKLAGAIRERMAAREIGAELDSIHIVAHGYGAYVASWAAANLQHDDEFVGQLTGFDVPLPPAGNDFGLTIEDDAFRVVDWYPARGGAIPSEPLVDMGRTNVMNVLLECIGSHSGVLTWYREHCVETPNPWASWPAPRVYPRPEVTVTRWDGSVDFDVFAQGYNGPPWVPSTPDHDSATGQTLSFPQVPRVIVANVVSNGTLGDDTAQLERVPAPLQIPPGSGAENAQVETYWDATAIGFNTASVDAEVVYTGELSVHQEACHPDPPLRVDFYGSLVTTGDNSEASYAFEVRRMSVGAATAQYERSHKQVGGWPFGKFEQVGTILLPPLSDDIPNDARDVTLEVSLRHGLLVEFAAPQHPEPAAPVASAHFNLLLPQLGVYLDGSAPGTRFLVTPEQPVRLVIHYPYHETQTTWQCVAGPDATIEARGSETWFVPSGPGLYVLRMTATGSAGSTVTVLMKIFVTGDLVDDCGSVIIRECPDAWCPDGWIENPGNGHCYRPALGSTGTGSWSDVEDEALAFGAHLVSLNDADENQWLVDTFGALGTWWIGFTYVFDGSHPTDGWAWTSSEPVTFTAWGPGEPEGDAGTKPWCFMGSDGLWHSAGLSTPPMLGIIERMPSEWIENPDNGHCYTLTASAASWGDAEQEAVSLGGHLVTINDSDELEWLIDTFESMESMAWMGFTDQDSEGWWRWVGDQDICAWPDGAPDVCYVNWSPGEPNNRPGDPESDEDYGEIHLSDNGLWNDVPSTDWKRGIIELVP